MNFKEFEAEILKRGIEEIKSLHDYGNFCVRYYYDKEHRWIAVVVAQNKLVKACTILSNIGKIDLAKTTETGPIKSFHSIIEKHYADYPFDKYPFTIQPRAVEIYAGRASQELLDKLKIIEVQNVVKIARRKVGLKKQFALPDPTLVEKVARLRAHVPCPNCERAYLHFRGKNEKMIVISCKHCGISYYK